jgi:hypothetical protein
MVNGSLYGFQPDKIALNYGMCAGLQLLADDLGGWGGISQDVLQQLREEYPTQPVLYFSLQQQQQQQQAAATSPGSLAQVR